LRICSGWGRTSNPRRWHPRRQHKRQRNEREPREIVTNAKSLQRNTGPPVCRCNVSTMQRCNALSAMIQNVLSSIGGVGIYGVISICLFVALFLGVMIRVLTLKKPYLKRMRELPLADDSTSPLSSDPNSKSEVGHE
jgi:hypothetical protein